MRWLRHEPPMAPFETTDDEVLGGRLKLLQPARGHRAGHDAILLAAAAPFAQRAIDLGAGVGTAGLALLARNAAERVTLVEIDAGLAALARDNAGRNGFGDRAEIVTADAFRLARRGGPDAPAAASADLVLVNPPFNDPARRNVSPDPARRRAHMAAEADLDLWIGAAERLLAPNGRLVLIHRPESIEALLATIKGRFGAAELIPIYPRPGASAIRLILRAVKGRRTPHALRPGISLNNVENQPTEIAAAILRDAAPFDPA